MKIKAVYTIVEQQDRGRKLWLRIGSATENRDGSLNVRLDAMPVNGMLHIRDVEDRPGEPVKPPLVTDHAFLESSLKDSCDYPTDHPGPDGRPSEATSEVCALRRDQHAR